MTARMNVKDQEKSPRSQSEPESGYKTDGSSSYSHIEDRVLEIQKKVVCIYKIKHEDGFIFQKVFSASFNYKTVPCLFMFNSLPNN